MPLDYNTAIDEQNKRNQSLSERIDEIAKQNDMWAKQGTDYIAGQPKADLYDPNQSVIQTLNLKTGSLAFTKAQQDKYDAGLRMLTDLLAGKSNQDQYEKTAEETRKQREIENSFREKQLAQEKELALAKLNPSEVSLTGGDKTAMRFSREIYSKAKQLESLWTSGLSGAGNYLMGNIKQAFNLPGGKESADYKKLIAQTNSAIRNKLSGTAVSEQEAKVLNGFLITGNDSDTTVQSKISGMIQYSKDSAQAILDTNSYEVDAGDYLNTTGKTGGVPSVQGKVLMIDPDGTEYQVDQSEVEEAKKNGWQTL